MKTKNNNAFSLIELIVSIGIIAILGIVAVSYQSSANDKLDNARINSDLNAIKNSLSTFQKDTSSLPNPSGNNMFYKADTSYAHDSSDDAYGVSGFLGNNTLAKKYLAMPPSDPRTKYFYAYAKTINNKYFELAGVEKKDNNYKSVVVGNYKVDSFSTLYNLVREYNGPGFVKEKSTIHFPYNPEEKVLNANIYDFSGSVYINKDSSKSVTGTGLINYNLIKGDSIYVDTGSLATIYFSDGSKSILGNKDSASELVLADMEYKEDNSLASKIKLVLNIGSIWTNASKLSNDSEFETYSDNTIAAVRGTIYGMTNYAGASKTNITLIRGKIALSSINSIPINDSGNISDKNGIISVVKGEAPKGLDITTGSTPPTSSTGSIDLTPISESEKADLISGEVGADINESFSLDPLIEKSSTGTISIKINSKKLKNFDDIVVTDISKTSIFVVPEAKGTDVIYSQKISNLNLDGNYRIILGNTSFSGSDLTSTGLTNIYDNSFGHIGLKARKITSRGERFSMQSDIHIGTNVVNLLTGDKKDKFVTFNGEKVENSLYNDLYDLVAYAGYNKAGDLNMYKKDNNDKLRIRTDFVSTGYLNNNGSGSSGNSYDLYDKNPMYIRNILEESNFIKDSSFIKTNKLVNGIFLDNDGTYDFLKYDISDLSLSGSDFAIEMSVRGAALKRSFTGVLFDIPGSIDGLRLSTLPYGLNNYLLLGKHLPINNQNIAINNLLFQDNKFYRIVATYSGPNNMKIYIYDGLNKISESTNYYLNPVNVGTLKDLYIGSYLDGNYKYQWNDIIDYVKIYKR